jgi:hypothetical protein
MAKKAKQWQSMGLPPAPEDTKGDWWDKVFQLKDERATWKLQQLAQECNEVEEELAIIDARRSELTALNEALDRRILEVLDQTGVEKVTIEGHTFSQRVDVEPQWVSRAEFIEWVLQTHPEMITVNAGHVKTIVKQALDPDEVETVPIAHRNDIPAGMPGSGKCPPGVVATTRRTLGSPKSKR